MDGGGNLTRLAHAAAAVEIGRRHPYLVLGLRAARWVVPLLLLAAAVVGGVYAVAHVDWARVPDVSGWLLGGAIAAAVLAVLVLAGRRWGGDVMWRLRVLLRLY